MRTLLFTSFILLATDSIAQITIPKSSNGVMTVSEIKKSDKKAKDYQRKLHKDLSSTKNQELEEITVGDDEQEKQAPKITLKRSDELAGCTKPNPRTISCPDGQFIRTHSVTESILKESAAPTKQQTDAPQSGGALLSR